MSLENYSDEELAQELKHRAEQRKREILLEREERTEFITKNLDVLLGLVLKHSRTSCSDDNICNTDRGCVRCNLIDSKHCGHWSDYYDLQIHVVKYPELD